MSFVSPLQLLLRPCPRRWLASRAQRWNADACTHAAVWRPCNSSLMQYDVHVGSLAKVAPGTMAGYRPGHDRMVICARPARQVAHVHQRTDSHQVLCQHVCGIQERVQHQAP